MIEDVMILSVYFGLMGIGFIVLGVLEKIVVHFMDKE